MKNKSNLPTVNPVQWFVVLRTTWGTIAVNNKLLPSHICKSAQGHYKSGQSNSNVTILSHTAVLDHNIKKKTKPITDQDRVI